MPKACSEQTDAEEKYVTQKIESNSEPSLDDNCHVVSLVLDVLSFFRFLHETILRAVGADSAETGKGFCRNISTTEATSWLGGLTGV